MAKLFLTSIAARTLDNFIPLLQDAPEEYKVAFIPTAADTYKDKSFIKEDRDKLIDLGFDVIDIDLKNKTMKELSGELKPCDIVFVAGGNSFYLLEKVKESGFDKIIRKLVKQKNIFYIGSSAGAVIVGPSIEPIKKLDDPSKASNLRSYEGLYLVDFVVLPHYGKEKYKEIYQKIIKKYGKKFNLIKITDMQAVIVEGNNFRIVETKR